MTEAERIAKLENDTSQLEQQNRQLRTELNMLNAAVGSLLFERSLRIEQVVELESMGYRH